MTFYSTNRKLLDTVMTAMEEAITDVTPENVDTWECEARAAIKALIQLQLEESAAAIQDKRLYGTDVTEWLKQFAVEHGVVL